MALLSVLSLVEKFKRLGFVHSQRHQLMGREGLSFSSHLYYHFGESCESCSGISWSETVGESFAPVAVCVFRVVLEPCDVQKCISLVVVFYVMCCPLKGVSFCFIVVC